MKLHSLKNSDAKDALSSIDFALKWSKLYSSCAWATVFQHPDFSRVWFANYDGDYSPIIFYCQSESGAFTHLLCLAQHKHDHTIKPCGAEQADYQCWLAVDDVFQDFLVDVVTAVQKMARQDVLRFKFLPPHLLRVLKSNNSEFLVICKSENRPLVSFDMTPAPWQSLEKKSNKSKISRLRRGGEIELSIHDHSRDGDELDSALRSMAMDYDFRQGAINDTRPFIEDASKFNFHRDLLLNTNCFKLLKLTVNGKIVAAIFGAESEGKFTVCVFSHSAVLAKHSPGKLLILMGARLLADRGLDAIDLTPGGEWKERFANAHEEVVDCTVYFSRRAYYQTRMFDLLKKCTKKLLTEHGLGLEKVSVDTQRFKKLKASDFLEKIRQYFGKKKSSEYRIYTYDVAKPMVYEDELVFGKNAVEEFLQFQPSQPWQTTKSFLRSSLARLEQGQIGYTRVDNGRLVHYGWLVPCQEKSFFTEVGKEYIYPKPGCVLYDFYTHPDERGKGLYSKLLKQMLSNAAADPNIQRVYISVLADNAPSRHVIEKVGFEYLESLTS